MDDYTDTVHIAVCDNCGEQCDVHYYDNDHELCFCCIECEEKFWDKQTGVHRYDTY